MTTHCHAAWNSRILVGIAYLTLLALRITPASAEPYGPALQADSESRIATFSKGYSLDAGSEESDAANALNFIGYWEHHSVHGSITLQVVSDEDVIVSGHAMKYVLLPGVLRVADEEGTFDYPYQLDSDRLILKFSDGNGMQRDIPFRRVLLEPEKIGYLPADRSYR